MALSDRGQQLTVPNDGSVMYKVLADTWHPTTNPNGYVSLGVAENTLSHGALSKHIHERMAVLDSTHFTYGSGFNGSPRLKRAMARFLNKRFDPVQPVNPTEITITNGCSAAVEHFSWCLANPGDGFLLGQPYYGTFTPDLTLRTGARLLPVAFHGADPLGSDAVQKYEQVLLDAKSKGEKVAGIILCSPHNPLSRCYPKEVIVGLIKLCEEHKIHLISDEIYALSVWSNTIDKSPAPTPFTSCLSILLENILDESRLHVIWGMSKDFGANGIRLGAVISRNNALHKAMVPLTLYSSPSSITDHVTANILEDDAWVDAHLSQNQKNLAHHYALVVEWAKKNRVPYAAGANAAFFLWVNLGEVYKRGFPELDLKTIESVLMEALLNQKVFLASGKVFAAEEPGWFRIVFAVDEVALLEGLKRVTRVIHGERAKL